MKSRRPSSCRRDHSVRCPLNVRSPSAHCPLFCARMNANQTSHVPPPMGTGRTRKDVKASELKRISLVRSVAPYTSLTQTTNKSLEPKRSHQGGNQDAASKSAPAVKLKHCACRPAALADMREKSRPTAIPNLERFPLDDDLRLSLKSVSW